MAVADANLVLRLSTGNATGNGNTAASTPNASLGGDVSTTILTNNSLHNLFDAVSGDENVALVPEYRLLFIHNNHATDVAGPNGKLWLFTNTVAGASTISIALDSTGQTALASAAVQSKIIANETTAPSPAETWSSPLTKAAGISLANLAAGFVLPVWIRRTPSNGGSRSNVTVALRAEWDVL